MSKYFNIPLSALAIAAAVYATPAQAAVRAKVWRTLPAPA